MKGVIAGLTSVAVVFGLVGEVKAQERQYTAQEQAYILEYVELINNASLTNEQRNVAMDANLDQTIELGKLRCQAFDQGYTDIQYREMIISDLISRGVTREQFSRIVPGFAAINIASVSVFCPEYINLVNR